MYFISEIVHIAAIVSSYTRIWRSL